MGNNLEDLSLTNKLLVQVNSSWIAQAVYVAVELQIAELLADGPRTSDTLAKDAGVQPATLDRLMRSLTTIDVCRQLDDGSFELTEMGRRLQADHPESIRSWIIWWATNLWQAWGNLLHSVKTGESARKLNAGIEGFSHLDNDPKQAAIFNQALVEVTRCIAKQVIRVYDFSQFKTIMDIGGGYGELLLTILKSNANVHGILFDRPHACPGAKDRFKKEGLESKCAFVEGDFFKAVPNGADVLILKSIIHDWEDDKARVILRNCRTAMSENGKLLLVERVLPEKVESTVEHRELVRSDLTMLVALGAKERSEEQYKELLNSAGFNINQFIPAGMSFKLIEAIPY